MGGLPDHFRYWGDEEVQPRPSADGEAVSLLGASVDAGAVVIGIGPYTNLARLEAVSPGSLARTQVVMCDQVQWSLGGISLAGWNFIASSLIAVFAFFAWQRRP